MARKKKSEQGRQRTPHDAIAHASASLTEIRALCRLYDTGHYLSSRTLANIISRFAQDELRLARLQGKVRLVSYAHPISRDNLLPQWRLIMVEMGTPTADGKTPITYQPISANPQAKTMLRFTDWWSDPIYIEGAGGSTGFIPVNGTPEIPFDKRRRLTRMSLISRLRNEIGAHYDGFESEEFAFSTKWNKCVSFSIVDERGRDLSIDRNPDFFSINNTFADAMVRAIAQEILDSDLLPEH